MSSTLPRKNIEQFHVSDNILKTIKFYLNINKNNL